MTEAIRVDCGLNLCVNVLVCLTESAVSERKPAMFLG
jgi:hypothetical protein